MKLWKLKYKFWQTKLIQEYKYLIYKTKAVLGIKTLGYDKFSGLILIRLLKRYKPSIYSMDIVSISDNLESVDLEYVHDYGLRLDKKEYLSIILNPNNKQVKIVVGNNLKQYINNSTKSEIEKIMQSKITEGEIIAGLESGMKKIKMLGLIN